MQKYRIRVDDELTLIYQLTRDVIPRAYEFNVGDVIRLESNTTGRGEDQPRYDRELIILPDGTITLPLLGQVTAAGRTVQELRDYIQERYKRWFTVSSWTITPLSVDTKLQDLRAAVDARAGRGGQDIRLRVTPDGTVQLPSIGSVCAQGLTVEELKFEIDQRYIEAGYLGIEVSPRIENRAPTFAFVLGEVRNPGRFTLERPTTAMQAIALAGGWTPGGNVRQIVIFRRAEDWRLLATKLDLRGALLGKRPGPADEIFLRDSDIVLVPKTPIRRLDDLIRLGFTEGINEVAFGILTLSAI